MFYNEYGDRENETIVLLHCAGILDMFEFMYDLSQKYHLVVPHILGTGNEVDRPYSLNGSVDGIIEIIEGLGKDKVYVVGHSLGGILAFSLLAQREDLIKKAIISSPMLSVSKLTLPFMTAYIRIMYPLLRSKTMGKIFVNFINLSKEKERIFLAYWSKVTLKTWVAYFSDGLDIKDFCHFGMVKTPILLMSGKKELKLIKKSIQSIRDLKSDCRVLEIEKMGHDHPVKAGEGFRKTLLDFFN